VKEERINFMSQISQVSSERIGTWSIPEKQSNLEFHKRLDGSFFVKWFEKISDENAVEREQIDESRITVRTKEELNEPVSHLFKDLPLELKKKLIHAGENMPAMQKNVTFINFGQGTSLDISCPGISLKSMENFYDIS
jgi:hypothetical protein